MQWLVSSRSRMGSVYVGSWCVYSTCARQLSRRCGLAGQGLRSNVDQQHSGYSAWSMWQSREHQEYAVHRSEAVDAHQLEAGAELAQEVVSSWPLECAPPSAASPVTVHQHIVQIQHQRLHVPAHWHISSAFCGRSKDCSAL